MLFTDVEDREADVKMYWVWCKRIFLNNNILRRIDFIILFTCTLRTSEYDRCIQGQLLTLKFWYLTWYLIWIKVPCFLPVSGTFCVHLGCECHPDLRFFCVSDGFGNLVRRKRYVYSLWIAHFERIAAVFLAPFQSNISILGDSFIWCPFWTVFP